MNEVRTRADRRNIAAVGITNERIKQKKRSMSITVRSRRRNTTKVMREDL